MDLSLTQEQEMIIGLVRRVVREEILPLELKLDPDADALDAADRDRLISKTKEMGLYGLDIPPEYGGPDIDLVTRTLIAVEMSQHRAGLYAPCYGVFGGAGLAQLFEATEEQKDKYLYPTLRGEKRGFFGLSEPSGGSDPARAIQTKAVRDLILVWFSPEQTPARVETELPALSLTLKHRGFTFGGLCIPFVQLTMQQSFSSKTWLYLRGISSVSSTKASRSLTIA